MILDIEKYPEFVPWCISGKIHKKDDRDDMIVIEADLTVGKRFLNQTYKSHVTYYKEKDKIIVTNLGGPLNTFLYENEQKKKEGTIKDGEKDGKWTEWYDNGQKTYEQNWKDGKLDGLVTHWFENGQKKSEITYKDGKNEIIGEWNEDGSVRE